ncbi:MAG: carboxypeptidase-like regulatory domain-containing protein [Flavobacteriales bacterium]|nr:carboxypeptidase-like regulatory domain-containing protein [Flavobacteriales bacterium]
MRLLSILYVLLLTGALYGQGEAYVRGVVRDQDGTPLPQANVLIPAESRGTTTDVDGRYRIAVPSGRSVTLRFSYSGRLEEEVTLTLSDGEERVVNIGLRYRTMEPVVVPGVRRIIDVGMEPLNPRVGVLNPSPTPGVEALLMGQIGVAMRNELSSGYSVRGGNFDENLVYVNDIEVYRPFLVRAGQQEGLSFPNADMIEQMQFSSGGFEARYGDKMSSVLDIHYKRPQGFAGSASAGLLGGSFHLENDMLKKRLRQITGFRYRTNQWLLQGLDTQGDYRPVYTDFQSYWTYDLSPTVELGFLGLYSRNRYGLVPSNRETEFGTFNQALRFTVYFDGQEVTQFETMFGALSVNVKPNRDLLLKFIGSAYNTYESETFDIQGQYFLDELERDLGSDQFGEVARNLGIGTFLDHARNYLNATVYTLAHRGTLERGNGVLQWGGDVKSELIQDRLSEWTMIDSADYSIPLNLGEDLELNYVLKSRLDMESIRASAYVQNAWKWNTGPKRWWTLVAGARAQHWTYNGQTVVSPRARLTYHPGWQRLNADSTITELDYSFWVAGGLYYQPAFYRELRKLDGTLNPDIRAQRSIHFLLGMDRRFDIWDRPFKVIGEVYYKYMDDLIPYQVDNIRIRYLGTNNARGYATGIDMKLSGQFIDGVDSWIGASVMSTREDLLDDFYYRRYNAAGEEIFAGFNFDQVAVDSVRVDPGYIRRPTDQRVNFAMFFQDEMPKWPTYKVHLNLVFGTNLPFGPPNGERYADTLTTGLYRRVDIGFSKQLLGAAGQERSDFLGKVKNMWVSLEVFNLLNINNTIDHTWVTDVSGRFYSIPDFLTPRRFNLKLVAWF